MKRRPSRYGNEPGLGSAQTEQVPQVTGQAAKIPVSAHRLTVFDAPTHEQYLEIIVPPRGIFSLNGELEQVLGEKEGI